MTQAEYARHRGVSRQAIGKAIAAGKIPVDDSDGQKRIDPAKADLALGVNVARVLADRDDADDRGAARPLSSGLTQAKTATEVYRARLAELEFNQRLGKLRPVDDITIGAQRCAEILMRQIGRITGRADQLAAMVAKDGVLGARAALRDIARELQRTASAEFAKLAAGELVDDEAGDDGEADAS